MNRLLVFLTVVLSCQVSAATAPQDIPTYYGVGLCDYPEFKCLTVGRGDSWDKLFPNPEQRDIVQRINRTSNYLYPGKEIAVPRDLEHATLLGMAPFSQSIDEHAKQIIIDQDKLAWGAYDEQGQLVHWGPISSGRDKCPDSNNSCRTMPGIFRVFSKENSHCKSDIFPIGRGGAPMP